METEQEVGVPANRGLVDLRQPLERFDRLPGLPARDRGTKTANCMFQKCKPLDS